MEKIKVAARHFWPNFYFNSSFFIAALKQVYQVEIINNVKRADLVFESCFPPRQVLPNRIVKKWKKWRGPGISGKRVFYSAEPLPLPVGTHHGIISYHLHLKENHFRWPVWMIYCDLGKDIRIRRKPNPDADFTTAQLTSVHLTSPKKFACTIFANPQHLRFKAAQWLERFGEVDVLGHSVNRPIFSKMAIMPDYKFNLCFENSIIPGYVTEKALQAKMAGCIPLYWGDPAYRVDFNAKSLINIYEYDCDFERIFATVDLEEVRQTPLLNEVPHHLLSNLAQFLERVMQAPASSVF